MHSFFDGVGNFFLPYAGEIAHTASCFLGPVL